MNLFSERVIFIPSVWTRDMMFGQFVIQSCSKQGKQITNGQKFNKDVIESSVYV